MPRIPPRLHKSGCHEIGPQNTSFGRDVVLVNPVDRAWNDHRFVLWFGAYGTTRLMVWADCLESAMEEAVDWIVDHAPGHLMDEQVEEAYLEAIASGMSEEAAQEHAEMDMTCFGHSGIHYLASWEWGIALEDPTREELDQFLFPPGLDWSHERK